MPPVKVDWHAVLRERGRDFIGPPSPDQVRWSVQLMRAIKASIADPVGASARQWGACFEWDWNETAEARGLKVAKESA